MRALLVAQLTEEVHFYGTLEEDGAKDSVVCHNGMGLQRLREHTIKKDRKTSRVPGENAVSDPNRCLQGQRSRTNFKETCQ